MENRPSQFSEQTSQEFEPARRSPRSSSITAPPLFGSENGPHSIYDSLNAAAYAYRLGINILMIIIIGNVLLLIVFLEYFYTDEIDHFMQQYKDHPMQLVLIFLIIYVVGCILMVPPNGVLITVAFTFAKVWGTVWGTFYAIVFNFFAQHIAHLATFFVGRYAFRDMIYRKMIRFKKFFILNRAIRKDGSYICFLARISFMCPHPLLTYALSVTDITVKQFINGNHSVLPLSFIYIYIGTSASTLSATANKRGSFWEKAEIYYFIITMALIFGAISYIWGLVAREVNRFEKEFDSEHPNGFNLKAAQQAELRRLEQEQQNAQLEASEGANNNQTAEPGLQNV